ncbi:hypothetical protein IVB18_26110 [Bradyrhizobium sp. 186]|uniref:hypothetical protein n=1 Tax=Bradyrhizobium sp. 186 TaxID=2782654 RepID=UPI002001A044|nr:hypothetical protein [Bradyrhizobium sp. 186]UPK31807.1 hypothetical protein IVB18_26110 [Bradyrhizobium sp. 186]
MAKRLIAIIEQTIRKEVAVPDRVPTGPFNVEAMDILNAINASNHSTIIKQRFVSAEVVEIAETPADADQQ